MPERGERETTEMGIEEYIVHKLGEKQGQSVVRDMIAECTSLERLCIGENEANSKTMRTKIFPRIAMYHVLQKDMPKQQAYDIVWNYTKDCICVPTRQQYLRIERVPFFFSLFRKMFLQTMLHSSEWSAEVTQNAADRFGVAIHRCLWNDTCLKCGCPELCQVFCDSDWENFGAMRKVKFCRTQTLGIGGNLCDFTFCKIHRK